MQTSAEHLRGRQFSGYAAAQPYFRQNCPKLIYLSAAVGS
jgi:hypothetical protein